MVLLASSSAMAASHTSTVNWIYALSSGSFILTFKTNSTQCTNSSTPQYYYVESGKNGVTAEGIKMIYSAALSGGATQKPVTINFDESSSACYVNRLSVDFQ